MKRLPALSAVCSLFLLVGTSAAQAPNVNQQQADLVLAVAVAAGPSRIESLTITANGAAAYAEEVAAPHGGRLHLITGLPAGPLTIDYTATIEGIAEIEQPTDLHRIEYARPSRYCDSDKLMPVAAAEFAGLSGKNLL